MNKLTDGSKKVGMHFSRSVAATSILFSACLVLLWIMLARFDSGDEANYQRLMQSQDDPQEVNAYTSRQRREGVQKDIFFSKNDQRLQLRLKSAQTELALDHHDRQTEIVEQMSDVTCFIQEELFYKLKDGREAVRQKDGRLLIKHADPAIADSWLTVDNPSLKPMQVIRQIEADTAFYYYKNSQFVAENVKVSQYVASGHSIEQATKSVQPLMGGVASWVEFSPAGNGINFKAYQLKAKLYTTGRN